MLQPSSQPAIQHHHQRITADRPVRGFNRNSGNILPCRPSNLLLLLHSLLTGWLATLLLHRDIDDNNNNLFFQQLQQINDSIRVLHRAVLYLKSSTNHGEWGEEGEEDRDLHRTAAPRRLRIKPFLQGDEKLPPEKWMDCGRRKDHQQLLHNFLLNKNKTSTPNSE